MLACRQKSVHFTSPTPFSLPLFSEAPFLRCPIPETPRKHRLHPAEVTMTATAHQKMTTTMTPWTALSFKKNLAQVLSPHLHSRNQTTTQHHLRAALHQVLKSQRAAVCTQTAAAAPLTRLASHQQPAMQHLPRLALQLVVSVQASFGIRRRVQRLPLLVMPLKFAEIGRFICSSRRCDTG